jgi:hypothetical protein
MLLNTLPPTIQPFPDLRHSLDTLQCPATHLYFLKPPENEKETHVDVLTKIGTLSESRLGCDWAVTTITKPSVSFDNWLFSKICFVEHGEICSMDVLLNWGKKRAKRAKKWAINLHEALKK